MDVETTTTAVYGPSYLVLFPQLKLEEFTEHYFEYSGVKLKEKVCLACNIATSLHMLQLDV